MIGAVAQPGMPDISKNTIGLYYKSEASVSYADLVNITGSGYFLGVASHAAAGSQGTTMYAQVIVDGVTVIDSPIAGGNYATGGGSSAIRRFNTSLVVKTKVSAFSAPFLASVALD